MSARTTPVQQSAICTTKSPLPSSVAELTIDLARLVSSSHSELMARGCRPAQLSEFLDRNPIRIDVGVRDIEPVRQVGPGVAGIHHQMSPDGTTETRSTIIEVPEAV